VQWLPASGGNEPGGGPVLADNDVELRVYPDSPLGFTSHPTAMARTALSGIHSWLRDRITQSPGPTAILEGSQS
jgi:hypothetical protein